MFCSKCGSPIDHDHHYCSQCGCSLEEWGVMSHHPPTTPSTNSDKKQPYWFYIVVIVAFLLMIWGFYSLFTGSDTLSNIAKSQLQEIKTNKLTKAYYEHTSKEFRDQNSLEEFKSFVEDHPSLKDYLNISIVKSEKDKKYGVVFLNLFLPSELVTQVKVEFVDEDGEWRILAISIEELSVENEQSQETEQAVIESVKAHLSAIKDGKLDEAYSMGAKEFLETTDKQGFRDFIQEHPALVTDKVVNMSALEREGSKVLVRVLLYSDGEPVPVDYIMVSEGDHWKVWSFYVLKPLSDEDVDEKQGLTEDLALPVQVFLQDLKDDEIDKAYEKTSEKFQVSTSFKQFQDFLNQFPIITVGEISPVKSKVSGDMGQARYKMKSGDQESTVDFILIKGEGDWKILGIQFVDDTKTAVEKDDENEEFDSSFLTKIITEQIEKIKEQDLYTAYEDYTSLKFRESTPFDSFARFVQQNSVFSNNKSFEFGELSFNNNLASVPVEMTSEDGTYEKVEFDLVKEGDSWKIVSIRLVNTDLSLVNTDLSSQDEQKRPSQHPKLVIEGIDVGTEVNLSGQITNPSTKIKSTGSEIFATLFLHHGENGVVVEVVFEHLDTGSTLPPVTKTLTESGNSRISLVFTPPKGGWPIGKYLLKGKTSTGEEKEIEFEVID